MMASQAGPTLQTLETIQEGLQNDKKKTQHTTIIPTNLLLKHKRPQHHKLNPIRAIRYRRNSQGQLVEDTTYRERRCLQLIQCKCSTDCNTLDTINIILNLYEPLKQAILRHKKTNPSLDHTYSDKRNMQLLHTYPSRNGHLVSFKDPPLPATLTYKTLPTQAHTIAMTIHVHAQEWLTLMSKVSRTNLTKPRKTSKYATHTNNDK